MKKTTLIFALLSGLTLTSPAQATLIDRGANLVYDTVLNVTWLADANRSMTWANANAWAAALDYGGYSDWRLPTTWQPDASCGNQSGGISSGYGCAGSEMGHLFYIDLGGIAGRSVLASSDPDLVLFPKIQSSPYWSGTGYVSPGDSSQYAWLFYMNDGFLGVDTTNGVYDVLAVRTGDVAVVPTPGNVPEPATVMLIGMGMGLLGLVRRGW